MNRTPYIRMRSDAVSQGSGEIDGELRHKLIPLSRARVHSGSTLRKVMVNWVRVYKWTWNACVVASFRNKNFSPSVHLWLAKYGHFEGTPSVQVICESNYLENANFNRIFNYILREDSRATHVKHPQSPLFNIHTVNISIFKKYLLLNILCDATAKMIGNETSNKGYCVTTKLFSLSWHEFLL